MYMHHEYRCPWRSGFLELDLQRVVNSLMWVLGTKSQSSVSRMSSNH